MEARHQRRLRELDEDWFWERIKDCVCEHARDLFGLTGNCDVCCWVYPKPSVVPVYRRAYEIANGPILKMRRLCVCHLCDNGFCVNPAHLVLGSAHDNNLDTLLRGRRNEAGKTATMTPETIRQIRYELAEGRKRKDIAARYQVSLTTIANISRGKSYKWVL